MRKLLVLLLCAACGPKASVAPVPLLPGDGDSHVAKPPPPKPPAALDPWSGKVELIAAPAPPATPGPVELPKIDELTLSNGLVVYVVKNDRVPVVSLQVAVRAGRMHEPRARLGVAEVTADLLVKGTKQHDAQALAKAIDAVGGTIGASSSFEATLVSCSALAKHVATCLDLVSEIVTQPTFPDAELAKRRDALVAGLRQRLDEPATLASSHAQNLLWGNDHVRGWINSEPSISAIRRDDVLAWHRTWFVPSNAMLVIVGDVDARKLRGELERALGGWRKGPVPPTPSYPVQGLSGSRIRVVDKPGLGQTQIRIAQYGIKHDDPRFFDTLVWNYVLGSGGPGSRLTRALVDGGKGFGASSSFDRNLDRGSIVVSSSARNADAVAITKLMLGEIARLAKDGPTKDELAAAIAAITGGYSLRFQIASDFAAAVVGAELHGFGHEYLTNYPAAVAQVSLDEARRAAAEILDPRAYVIVLVGDAKDLEPQLKQEGWRYEKVAFTDPVTAPVVAPEQPVDPKAVTAARKVIDEALAAKGGKAKLAGLKALKMTATGATTMQGQNVPVDIERVFVFPDKMRIDATIKPPRGPASVVVSIGVSGEAGWQRGPDPKNGAYVVADITGSGLATIDFERWREPELILLKASQPTAKLTPVADETIEGRPHAVIKLRAPVGDVEVTMYIDKKTKLITRMSYSDSGSMETDDFADYRDVGGLKIAHKRTSGGSGRSTTLEVKTVELDPKVDLAVFAKPAA